ncbi:hypothetical protein Pfo_030240 [Paulownia fortunei]|nr:hypothetical protein Pfo_030240 [Paulownia fortunei]
MTMAKSLHLHLLLHLRRSKSMYASPTMTLRLLSLPSKPIKCTSPRFLSTTATPYPLQYEMIISRPANPPHPQPPAVAHQPPSLSPNPKIQDSTRIWVSTHGSIKSYPAKILIIAKILILIIITENQSWTRLRESIIIKGGKECMENRRRTRKTVVGERQVVFFEESEKEGKDVKVEDVTEKKVGDFFKCLKKFPNENGGDVAVVEPFLSTRSVGLPPKWDGPNGTVVLVNKPKGWTSFTVCGKLRRLVKVKKVGHAGTLDPMATGLLIVCVGKATKLVDRYQGMIKGYSGIFRLGEATSTWDADSPVIQREPWEHIKDEDIKKAAASFCGEIWQVPPMFSAIKVGGERMYEKARKGESIELSPRRISIFNFDIERSLNDRQNVVFRVTCSKGTYVRSLCADFGKALGSCAHLTALRRDSIGEYSADDAWEFQELEEEVTKGYI